VKSLAELWSSPRVRLWALLVVLLLVSVGALLLALSSRKGAAAPPPPIEVRVVDEAGKPLAGAEVRLRRRPGEGARTGETWSPEEALLTLPRAGAPYALAAFARGRKLVLLEGILESRTIALGRGHVVRLRVSASVPPVDPPLQIVMKVTPGADLPAEEGLDLADLMEIRDPQHGNTPPLPRQGFGFAVSRQDGAAGVLLPSPGGYVVTWGLLDTQAGTWFALQEGSRTEFRLEDAAEPQVVEVPVTVEALERTQKGLEERIRMLRAR
jgi:hypothetical protein